MWALVALSVAVLTSVAGPTVAEAALLGTPDLPDLPDASGDTYYPPLYPRSGEYADFTGAWFELDQTADLVLLTMRTEEAENLSRLPPGVQVECEVTGNVTRDGEPAGGLTFRWTRMWDNSGVVTSGKLQTTVFWAKQRNATAGAVRDGAILEVEHSFEAKLGTPGLFKFILNRAALLQLGEAFKDLHAFCAEQVVSLRANIGFDQAESQTVISFEDKQRTGPPSGAIDPVEEFEKRNARRTGEPASTESAGTPGAGGLFALVSLLVVTLLILQRRPV